MRAPTRVQGPRMLSWTWASLWIRGLLAGSFAANHWAFHGADGRGYRFLADMILAADKLNPQTAARLRFHRM